VPGFFNGEPYVACCTGHGVGAAQKSQVLPRHGNTSFSSWSERGYEEDYLLLTASDQVGPHVVDGRRADVSDDQVDLGQEFDCGFLVIVHALFEEIFIIGDTRLFGRWPFQPGGDEFGLRSAVAQFLPVIPALLDAESPVGETGSYEGADCGEDGAYGFDPARHVPPLSHDDRLSPVLEALADLDRHLDGRGMVRKTFANAPWVGRAAGAIVTDPLDANCWGVETFRGTV
jgi:hypothetical protein